MQFHEVINLLPRNRYGMYMKTLAMTCIHTEKHVMNMNEFIEPVPQFENEMASICNLAQAGAWIDKTYAKSIL